MYIWGFITEVALYSYIFLHLYKKAYTGEADARKPYSVTVNSLSCPCDLMRVFLP